jgi:predicted AAA+ superfamily ATPase
MELRKQCAWSATRPELFYWRTASGQEVDIVLEDRSRKVVGVEGKAAATLGNNDLRGLHASLSCQFMQRPFSQILYNSSARRHGTEHRFIYRLS